MDARRRTAVIAVASAMVTGLAVSAPAYADEPAGTAEDTAAQCDANGNCGDGGGDGGSSGGEIDVEVWGTYTSPGKTGDDGSIETVVVTVPPVCWYGRSMTGEDYYDYVESGRARAAWEKHGLPGEFEPFPNYADYQDKGEDDGRWHEMHCDRSRYEGEDFLEYVQQWRDDNPAVFVETDEEPPVGDIPPETLMEAAYDAMDLPESEYAWNPQREGDDASFVNLPTWLWVEDGPVEVEIHAEAAGNQATVSAAVDTITYSAPTADSEQCAGYGAQDSDECSLTFDRSSAHLPGNVTPVTAETAWSIDWTYNGEPQGALDPQTTTQTFDIPVAEIQTTVTND